ncbi:MAG: NAD(P)/FAD-dependent oxidoreductase [Planctomycetes bacterium]|nr:NAD(P)/FAD-dependent oxidoreductase [Planctomycetota bacterium]
MPRLLMVGGGLFGSQAAAYARRRGIEALVFDAGLPGAASPAAAGLFKEAWAGKKLRHHFDRALPILDQLYGIRHVDLTHDDGSKETFLFVPPTAILEPTPIRQTVTAVGDGWLEAGGERHEGWVYIAAGIWCETFHAGLGVYGKAGAAYVFAGEREGRLRPISHGRQSIAFVRDAGMTHISDGTAERVYLLEHDQQTLDRAASLGLTQPPIQRLWGQRPYTPGGPVFLKIGQRTWLATGGRKMGTILGASFAQLLVDEELLR